MSTFRNIAKAICVAVLWVVAYSCTTMFADFITYSIIGLDKGTHIAASLHFFIYDTAKILLLMVMLIYVIGFLRASLNVERVRCYLVGKNSFFAYISASIFGAVTPFCSCSSVPLFIGFTTAKIPIGITMAFLITSPIINEVAVVILLSLLGWKFTLAYVIIGLSMGVIGGFIMNTIKAEQYLQDYLRQDYGNINTSYDNKKLSILDRHKFAYSEMTSITKRIWKWVVIGVGVGALLHGYVPEEFITKYLSSNNILSVPVAVILGIPLYTNATAVIPIIESLIVKGLPIGTTLALSMSAVALSLPEMIMLKQVMKTKLIAIFVAVMFTLFVIIGWVINILSPYLTY